MYNRSYVYAVGLIDIVGLHERGLAVADCFSALKSSRKNLPIVFPVNREISLFCGPSTWNLWGCLHPYKVRLWSFNRCGVVVGHLIKLLIYAD